MRDGIVVANESVKETNYNFLIEKMLGRSLKTMYPRINEKVGEKYFEVKNFSVTDPSNNKKIIKDVSFDLRRGEILGIFGLVGSGRTELLMSIFGMLPNVNNSGELFPFT